MPIQQSVLLENAKSFKKSMNEGRIVTEGVGVPPQMTAFLCHSHHDKLLVEGIIKLFRDSGVKLYIDWMDQSMPAVPNSQTAQNIKERIKAASLFLFLATEGAKLSRWCPWEIGYADGVRKDVIIIPTKVGDNEYGNEYLQLYKHIDTGKSEAGKTGLALFEGSEKGKFLSSLGW